MTSGSSLTRSILAPVRRARRAPPGAHSGAGEFGRDAKWRPELVGAVDPMTGPSHAVRSRGVGPDGDGACVGSPRALDDPPAPRHRPRPCPASRHRARPTGASRGDPTMTSTVLRTGCAAPTVHRHDRQPRSPPSTCDGRRRGDGRTRASTTRRLRLIPLPLQPRIPFPLRPCVVSGLYRRSTGLVHPIGFPLAPAERAGDVHAAPRGAGAAAGASPAGCRPTASTGCRIADAAACRCRGWAPARSSGSTSTAATRRWWSAGRSAAGSSAGAAGSPTSRPRAGGGWEGDITYKHGTARLMPYTHVEVAARRRTCLRQRARGRHVLRRREHHAAGAPTPSPPPRSTTSRWSSTARATPTRSPTSTPDSHPNRPATLPVENLSHRDGLRPGRLPGRRSPAATTSCRWPARARDAKWTNQEMHDAMQSYWSRFANIAQWSVWTLFAGQSSRGHQPRRDHVRRHRHRPAPGLRHLQRLVHLRPRPAGTRTGPPSCNRMRFWTAVHELGHTFNLRTPGRRRSGTPWIPLANEPEARTFMNYPYNVAGGTHRVLRRTSSTGSATPSCCSCGTRRRSSSSRATRPGSSTTASAGGDLPGARARPHHAGAAATRRFRVPRADRGGAEAGQHHRPPGGDRPQPARRGDLTLLATDRRGEVTASRRRSRTTCMQARADRADAGGVDLRLDAGLGQPHRGRSWSTRATTRCRRRCTCPRRTSSRSRSGSRCSPPMDRTAEVLAADVLDRGRPTGAGLRRQPRCSTRPTTSCARSSSRCPGPRSRPRRRSRWPGRRRRKRLVLRAAERRTPAT